MNLIEVDRRLPALAIVTLCRRDKRNAVSLAMWQQLASEFESLANERPVRTIIITGDGEHFCAGADIAEFQRIRHTAQQCHDYDQAVDAATQRIMDSPAATIATISGSCFGGGCSLAMACDFRIADRNSIFRIPAAQLGIVYGASDTRNLLQLVGASRAKQILFSAAPFNADTALDIGFIDRVADDSAMQAAQEFAAEIIANAPASVASAKAILSSLRIGIDADTKHLAQQWQSQAARSDDYREGVAAFLEKRRPGFTGL
ncbi:MAG: enoyl-CoA hydratase-related protein [Gammaproteobacteria bacterium]|nr:enoyl-CoA hydratase-related protein [Gammaproteobacteria bacterium]MDH3469430.1 enoyl-CoA hydratase-related protein [Gammaproteobacteria bacterium]